MGYGQGYGYGIERAATRRRFGGPVLSALARIIVGSDTDWSDAHISAWEALAAGIETYWAGQPQIVAPLLGPDHTRATTRGALWDGSAWSAVSMTPYNWTSGAYNTATGLIGGATTWIDSNVALSDDLGATAADWSSVAAVHTAGTSASYRQIIGTCNDTLASPFYGLGYRPSSGQAYAIASGGETYADSGTAAVAGRFVGIANSGTSMRLYRNGASTIEETGSRSIAPIADNHVGFFAYQIASTFANGVRATLLMAGQKPANGYTDIAAIDALIDAFNTARAA